jgi:hypothetical protein
VTSAAPGFDLVLQDYPASGHQPVSVTALAAVCAAHEEIRCVKAEDPPTPRKVAALAERADVAQLGGLGGLHLLAELDAGTDGTMTGFAFPEVLAAIVAAADAGDRDEAGRLYEGALGALTWEAQPEIGLALRKLLLAERGLLPCPRLRHPVPFRPMRPAGAGHRRTRHPAAAGGPVMTTVVQSLIDGRWAVPTPPTAPSTSTRPGAKRFSPRCRSRPPRTRPGPSVPRPPQRPPGARGRRWSAGASCAARRRSSPSAARSSRGS